MEPVRTLAASQVEELAKLDESYLSYDAFLKEKGFRNPNKPRPVEAGSPLARWSPLRGKRRPPPADTDLRQALAKSYGELAAAEQSLGIYYTEPLGSRAAEAPDGAPEGPDAAEFAVYSELAGEAGLPAGVVGDLLRDLNRGRAQVCMQWARDLETPGVDFLDGDEECARLYLMRAELWGRDLLEERYHKYTIDTSLFRARCAAESVSEDDYPAHERDEEILRRTEECVRLLAIKRRIIDSEYRCRTTAQRRRQDLMRQKIKTAQELGVFVRKATVMGAEQALVQERRLHLLAKHEQIEHWREFIAFDCFDDLTYAAARASLNEFADSQRWSEQRLRDLRFRLDSIQGYWAAARQDLLDLGVESEDPIEGAWDEARDRRERAIARAEEMLAEKEAERQRDISAMLAMLSAGGQEEEQAAFDGAAAEGRARGAAEREAAAAAQLEKLPPPPPVASPELEARAAREVLEQAREEMDKVRGERLKPQVSDLEPLLLQYGAPITDPDPLGAHVAQGDVDLTVVYANMCIVHCLKPNQQVATILRSSGSEHVDLSTVFVGRNVLPRVLELLKFLPKLRRLSIANCDLDNALWARVAPQLRCMRHLVDLDISNNPALCDWEALLDFLRHNWRVTTLRRKGITFFPNTAAQKLRDQLIANRESCAGEVAARR
eukprot:TRINITY_DN3080_c1_g3_i1.p1 TRINITY_DN3080_c1_g3~~TRINITY_DN3080_c1_g3_i1.p1  ORF type:complete len:688 (+),score=225.36 TRINITY_DN3080_c1_g3_i1:72-2066(+)